MCSRDTYADTSQPRDTSFITLMLFDNNTIVDLYNFEGFDSTVFSVVISSSAALCLLLEITANGR